jgi:hypothetical protein
MKFQEILKTKGSYLIKSDKNCELRLPLVGGDCFFNLLLAGLVTSKIMAESVFSFISIVSLYLIGSTVVILKIVQRQTERNAGFGYGDLRV